MLTRTSLSVIIFAVLVGIFILITNMYLSISNAAVTTISQIMPNQSLVTGSPYQSLSAGAVNSVFNTGLLPESNDIEASVSPSDNTLAMYRNRGTMLNPSRAAVMDPVLELNQVSPVYTAHPEFSDIRNGIVKPNVPMPVPTSVTV